MSQVTQRISKLKKGGAEKDKMARGALVINNPSHKWSEAAFQTHVTSLGTQDHRLGCRRLILRQCVYVQLGNSTYQGSI